jgi:hypothetical protein
MAVFALPSAFAQDAQDSPPVPAVKGHITSLSLPSAFAVNGRKVAIDPSTTYRFINEKGVKLSGAGVTALQLGAEVAVMGAKSKGIVHASAVYVLDDTTQKISGFGLVDKVIATSPDLVIRADGYRVRVGPNTATSFSGSLKSLADVNTNTWVKYEGKLDRDGSLVPTHFAFYPGKAGKRDGSMPAPQQEVLAQNNLLDADGNFHNIHGKYRLNQLDGECGWHWAPVDPTVQKRVARIGASLVPAYQKQLAENDRAKIDFRFYVVKEPQFRSGFGCSSGLVLVPEAVVQRLKSDDQLAAVLADGISANLEWQSARLIAEYWSITGIEIAADVAAGFSGWGLLAQAGTDVAKRVAERRFIEQRGRVALALMSDAGYDPWAAPEAWRILGPRKLPKNPSKLKYTPLGTYQLAILHEEYRKENDSVSTQITVPEPDAWPTQAHSTR